MKSGPCQDNGRHSVIFVNISASIGERFALRQCFITLAIVTSNVGVVLPKFTQPSETA